MKKKILIVLLVLLGFLVMGKVLALEVNWPTSPFGTDLTDSSKLQDMVKYFYEWGIAIGGIAVFIALLIGGFLYLTSAGDPGRLRAAKDRIFSALTGLALLLGSWIILNTINPELTVLRPPSFEKPKVGIDLSALEAATEKKSCNYVRLYSQPYWKGDSLVLPSMTDPIIADVQSTFGEDGPKSIRFFRKCEQFETCVNNQLVLVTTTTVATTVDTEVTTTEKTITSTTPIFCEELPPSPPLPTDLNQDGVVDGEDLSLCKQNDLKCDLNNNGVVDLADILVVTGTLGRGSLPGGCYREGGSCSVEFHEKTDETILWVIKVGVKCGDKKGNTSGSLHNIKLAYYSDNYIKCVKVAKTGFEE